MARPAARPRGVNGMGQVTLFLCGDVMPGRGVDQILPHPGDPRLRERGVHDARRYVAEAESVNGPIDRPVGYSWPWGSALREIAAVSPDARLINLECAVTRCGEFAAGKGVHYRMNPDNIGVLSAGGPDVCALANNHLLDFGRRGLTDTLDELTAAGLGWAGAGRDAAEARRPAIVPISGGGRVVVVSAGAETSGIPASWAATPERPGVNRLPDLTEATADVLAERARAVTLPGDVVVVSIHWGPNWGYRVSGEESAFAHRLVDGGIDVVHGHSSHHPRPIEVYRNRLVLYGCGDFIDDYEGIAGYESYRDDLRLLYFATIDAATGELAELRMAPMRARRMRLRPASHEDARWLRSTLSRVSRPFGTRVELRPDGVLVAGW